MNTESTEIPAPNARPPIRKFRLVVICLGLLIIAGAVAWQYELLPGLQPSPRENAIMVIAPYRYQGTWVFDDSSAGLVKDIPNADSGFRLLFGASPFPGHQKKLTWLRGDSSGNYYSMDDPPMEGWICPAMFKYYSKAPKFLYVKAEPIK